MPKLTITKAKNGWVVDAEADGKSNTYVFSSAEESELIKAIFQILELSYVDSQNK